MAVIRLILLVAVLGTLTLLLVQNWSPVLPLVFLGMRTQALPLAIWILFSTAAGAVTSLLIAGLFNSTGQKRQTPLKSPATSPRVANRTRREEPFSRKQAPPSTVSEVDPRTSDELDDWDTDRSANDDWDFDENNNVTSNSSPQNTQTRDSDTYERQQEPKSGSKSGSVYSYSYQEPKNSGVGKTESVYDADYRVIVPPYQPPTTKSTDDDDWGLFDDDDTEDKDKRSRQ